MTARQHAGCNAYGSGIGDHADVGRADGRVGAPRCSMGSSITSARSAQPTPEFPITTTLSVEAEEAILSSPQLSSPGVPHRGLVPRPKAKILVDGGDPRETQM